MGSVSRIGKPLESYKCHTYSPQSVVEFSKANYRYMVSVATIYFIDSMLDTARVVFEHAATLSSISGISIDAAPSIATPFGVKGVITNTYPSTS